MMNSRFQYHIWLSCKDKFNARGWILLMTKSDSSIVLFDYFKIRLSVLNYVDRHISDLNSCIWKSVLFSLRQDLPKCLGFVVGAFVSTFLKNSTKMFELFFFQRKFLLRFLEWISWNFMNNHISSVNSVHIWFWMNFIDSSIMLIDRS